MASKLRFLPLVPPGILDSCTPSCRLSFSPIVYTAIPPLPFLSFFLLLSNSLSLSLSLSFFMSLFLFLPLYLSLPPPSLSFFISLSFFMSLSPSLPIFLSLSFFLSLSQYKRKITLIIWANQLKILWKTSMRDMLL